ncbi:hypothetical protein RND71_006373 [Anisodus tanguticus]|uniref:DUF4283 domain-containing protein n=1 Tax=Anisodus tanguticus TaxID=243964 RepID=A0AAE1SVZ7_9SOLA|nr:hypothetical protein RND71_006373 [Anisodus tanguticus]
MGKRKKKKEVFKPLNIRVGQAPIEVGINDPVVFPPIAPGPALQRTAGNGIQAGGDNTGVKFTLAKEGASDFTPSSVTLGSKDTTSDSGSINGDTAKNEPTPKENQDKGTSQNKKAYASVLKGNDERLQWETADIDDLTDTWGYLLIGYFAGTFPGNIALMKLCRSWGVTYRFTVHASGWIIFKFNSEADKEKVMANGPHFVYSTPLLLKDIPHCFTFDRQEICTIPIWVRLPSLPLELWNEMALSRILSRIGRPIGTDKLTNDKGQASYARALVEIDLSKEVVHSVELKLWDGTHIDQDLVYEKRPGYCNKCKQIGHYAEGCEKHKAEIKKRLQGKGVIHTPNAAAKGVHTYLDDEGRAHSQENGTTSVVGEKDVSMGGQPSGVQIGAGKGRTGTHKNDSQRAGKAPVDLITSDKITGGQPSGIQTGTGKGGTEFRKIEGKLVGKTMAVGLTKGVEDVAKGAELRGQPIGDQTEAGKGRRSGEATDGQPSGTQTEAGKGGISGEATDGQPSGTQTEAGKGGNSQDTAKEQIFAPQTVRPKEAEGSTTSQAHSAISPAVIQSAIFRKLADMHGNIEEQNKIDHKAKTAIEIAMAQGGGEVGSTSGGQPTGAQTVAGKGRTTLAAQPVGPSARDGKGGNNDRESKVTPDEDGYMETTRFVGLARVSRPPGVWDRRE